MNSDADGFSFIGRHFVTLGWIDRTPGERARANGGAGTPFDTSAFILSVDGHWFVITAGHILQDLQAAKDRDQKLVHFVLNDTWCGRTYQDGIPLSLDYILEKSFCLYDGSLGLDCGCIYLSPNYVSLLEANGIVPLPEDAWRLSNPDQCEFFMMFGIPSKLASVKLEGKHAERQLAAVWLNLRHIDEAEVPPHMRKGGCRFYGRLAPELRCHDTGEVVDDIDGMSGGPIMGFRRTEQGLACWVVAIQSGWDPKEHIVAGFPMYIVGNALAAAMRQITRAQGNLAPTSRPGDDPPSPSPGPPRRH